MAKCVFLFIALVIFLRNDASSKKHESKFVRTSRGKIVGGYVTTIKSYPYQAYVLVEKDGKYYQCGGSIISPRYVLTAAHCLTGVTAVYIRTGSTNSDSGGSLDYTPTYKVHPKYNSKTSDYDIGVVDLRKNIQLDGTNAKAIQLPRENTSVQPGTEIVISGWGATSEGGDSSQNLMAVKVPTVSTENCRKSYGSSITSHMFCAGNPKGGKDSCQGDSGGPAVSVSSGTQLGIVSFGVGCARAGYPGVYTNISAVRSWIRSNTGV